MRTWQTQTHRHAQMTCDMLVTQQLLPGIPVTRIQPWKKIRHMLYMCFQPSNQEITSGTLAPNMVQLHSCNTLQTGNCLNMFKSKRLFHVFPTTTCSTEITSLHQFTRFLCLQQCACGKWSQVRFRHEVCRATLTRDYNCFGPTYTTWLNPFLSLLHYILGFELAIG